MNTHLGLANLLGAQPDAFWQELARSIGVNRQDLPWLIAVAVLALLAVLGTGVWLTLHALAARRHHPCNDGMKLFLELCRAHQLDRASRRLLQRLANAHGLSQPAVLFVEPERYDIVEHDHQYVRRVFGRSRRHAPIGNRLFWGQSDRAAEAFSLPGHSGHLLPGPRMVFLPIS